MSERTIQQAIEHEMNFKQEIRWSPCSVCQKSEQCEQECLRFAEFVSYEAPKVRKHKFISFAEKNGLVHA